VANLKIGAGWKRHCSGSGAAEQCSKQAWKQFNYRLIFALEENHQKAQCCHNVAL